MDKKMKRASVNLQKFNPVDVEINVKVKHQTLLNEYLDLQKDFVSKKRKFQVAKQKRDNLLAIVKFLRQKRQFLLNRQTSTAETNINLVDWGNAATETSILEKIRKYAAHEAVLRHEERGGKLAQLEQMVREGSRK